MKDLFTIGELSRLFNINIKTLRYYDEINLFKPIFVDRMNSYRYYSTEQFEQLNTIIYLKALGMSLNTISFHLNKRGIDNITELLNKQREITKEKIKELQRIEKKIENRLSQINYAIQCSSLDMVQELKFNERTVVLLKQRIKSDRDLELSIRNLENNTNKSASIFNGKVGVSISKAKLKSRIFEEYDSIFLFTEGEEYSDKLLKVLPKGIYITIRFNGTHKDSPKYYYKLLKYIEEKGYAIGDDSIEITLIDFGLTTKRSEFITEIQILIE
ncbi:MerR family transcriptional regulator [Clostridium felsineum]|uniref:Multidrug-efflux transporter 1 regulator n=1 Tax=Clostridium felsineum TaxID=36839 RepID=A0A1S8LPT2_9CLOT|nr:MerR family transcriptional regulator [Clostridium felsineum]URZ08602.1 Multidrug-efflux transporter 1 regulator [Clostridium felsineum]URZ13633.1 Multidrug-efflux transporter 1 regulator [Clostridium felsineum]